MASSRRRVLHAMTATMALAALTLLSQSARPAATAHADKGSSLLPVAIGNIEVSVFARGGAQYSHPDSIIADQGHVFVAYQNLTPKDGSLSMNSTIVEYSAGEGGRPLRSFNIAGHCDGLRMNPVTHQLWATVNEDSNARLYTIDLSTGKITPYTFSAAPHGGGYDDLQFVNGQAFVAASNPNLNAAGVNIFPAVDTIKLMGGMAVVTPILTSTAALNLTDPDSLTVTPQGDLVLTDQADALLVFLHHPGTQQQTVSQLTVGTQLDDSAWVTSRTGRLFVVDGQQNAVYTLRASFAPGTVYTEAPSDSGVAGFVGTLNLQSGAISPVAIGFGSPTGLLFAPDRHDETGGDGGSSPEAP